MCSDTSSRPTEVCQCKGPQMSDFVNVHSILAKISPVFCVSDFCRLVVKRNVPCFFNRRPRTIGGVWSGFSGAMVLGD